MHAFDRMVADCRSSRHRNVLGFAQFPHPELAGIAVPDCGGRCFGWTHGWYGLGQSFLGMGAGALVFGFLFWMGGMRIIQSTGDLIFGLKKRGLRRHPERVLGNPLMRRMPYAPAIAIGTLFSFFARYGQTIMVTSSTTSKTQFAWRSDSTPEKIVER